MRRRMRRARFTAPTLALEAAAAKGQMSLMGRGDLEAIWRAGGAACQPARVVPPHLPDPPRGRTILLALGKAAVPMARAVEAHWRGSLEGLAVAPRGAAAPLGRIQAVAAGQPLPDRASMTAAARLLRLAEGAGPDDLVLLLLSGGASALACLPGVGLSLEVKRQLSDRLLRSGAGIGEINIVRRHLSRFKGGRLALAAAPARLVTLAISDTFLDRPEDIGSGPTAADPTTLEDALEVLRVHGIAAPEAGWSETPKAVPGDYRIVARGREALEAAAAEAERRGYRPRAFECEGEARRVGAEHAKLARALAPGEALISGGELTVTVTRGGRGGAHPGYSPPPPLRPQGARGPARPAGGTPGVDGKSGPPRALL